MLISAYVCALHGIIFFYSFFYCIPCIIWWRGNNIYIYVCIRMYAYVCMCVHIHSLVVTNSSIANVCSFFFFISTPKNTFTWMSYFLQKETLIIMYTRRIVATEIVRLDFFWVFSSLYYVVVHEFWHFQHLRHAYIQTCMHTYMYMCSHVCSAQKTQRLLFIMRNRFFTFVKWIV